MPRGSQRAAERLGAYMALSGCYRAIRGEDMPRLMFDERGKPYAEGDISFSLSHRQGIAAVALASPVNGACGEALNSDEIAQKLDTPPQIGVDIEWIMEGERAKHICARYSAHFTALGSAFGLPSAEVTYLSAELDERGELFLRGAFVPCYGDNGNFDKLTSIAELDVEPDEQSPSPEAVTGMWTRLEALLKASGGGFCDLSKINDIIPVSESATIKGSLAGRDYMLTVARLPNN